jgi:hypothetical protein
VNHRASDLHDLLLPKRQRPNASIEGEVLAEALQAR